MFIVLCVTKRIKLYCPKDSLFAYILKENVYKSRLRFIE